MQKKPTQPVNHPAMIEVYGRVWHCKRKGIKLHTLRVIADGETVINTLGSRHTKSEGGQEAIEYRAARELKSRNKVAITALSGLKSYCEKRGIILHFHVSEVSTRVQL